MEGEPNYRHWNLAMSPQERRSIRKRLIKGGKIADRVRKMAKLQHEVEEVPVAEKTMEEGLVNVNGAKLQDSFGLASSNNETKSKAHWWQVLIHFFQKLLIP